MQSFSFWSHRAASRNSESGRKVGETEIRGTEQENNGNNSGNYCPHSNLFAVGFQYNPGLVPVWFL